MSAVPAVPSRFPALWRDVSRVALSPWSIPASLALGAAVGMLWPAWGRSLGGVGAIYVDLLKMIVLPFIVSAVIFSLQRLAREGDAGRVLARVAGVFVLFAVATALAGALATGIAAPGANLPDSTRQTLGNMVGADASQSNTEVSLVAPQAEPAGVSLREVIGSLVPSNIFASLANGEALKALVFALLFGLAAGAVPARIADGFTHSLETIYQSCQTLTRWLNYPVPLVLFCMAAYQAAATGLEPLRAMGGFVLTLFAVSTLLVLVALVLIRRRADQPWRVVLSAFRAPFALAVATRSSATCMPAMIESLADHLGFARARVELLVPLSISLLRIGPILYYVCATLFIAQLYDRSLSAAEVGLVVFVSVLAGFASAGMSGLVTLSLVATTTSYLGLPFEAAFVLLAAVDPLCDLARTVLIVIGNSAAVAMICPRPLRV